MKLAIIISICLFAALNVITSKRWSATEMKENYIDGQCIVGKIAANIFYFPAWVLKGLKFVIDFLVK